MTRPANAAFKKRRCDDRLPRLLSLTLGIGLAASAAHAQTAPDAGSLLRETQREAPVPTPPPSATTKIAPSPVVPGDDRMRFVVKQFRIVGASRIPLEDLQALLQPWRGRPIGFADLALAATAVNEEYRRHGWLARTQLPTQNIDDGTVTLKVIEARFGKVVIDDGTANGQSPLRLKREHIEAMMTARQKPGEPLRLDDLERANNLVNDTPGIAASVSLAPGAADGETDVVVRPTDRPLWAGALQYDNYGARSTGEQRIGAQASLDDPSGIGDQVVAGTVLSTGSQFGRLGYSLPMGADGARLGVNASLLHYKLGREFKVLDAKGDAATLGVTGTYALVRSGERNIAASWALEDREYVNDANGQQSSRISVQTLVLGVSGDLTDKLGQGGFTLWNANLTIGHVGLGGNAVNQAADRAGPGTEGGFGKLSFGASRLQRLGDRTTLWASLAGQWAANNLDSSEKFSLGGPYGVRAYPSLEGQGDSGVLANIEVRQALHPEWQAVAFYDHGYVVRNHDANFAGAPTPNTASLKGLGVGLTWSRPGNVSVRATLAHRVGSNPLANAATGRDSDGSRSLNRFWINVVKYF